MTDAPSRAVMLYGTDEPPAETRVLAAGPLTAELDAGNLRYIRFGGREAIRAISYVARDQFWGTFSAEISGLEVEEYPGGFTVSYSATCRNAEQSFTYHAKITGTPTSLRFEAEGAGDTDFLTNRTGFVVLHGVEGITGEPVAVEHVDQRVVETRFPEIIDPDCPIRDVRALTHSVAPGLRVRCEMTGDTFEMEDQRNWTDASYKTYVRPLSLPHPYTLAKGERITQAVSLTFEGPAPAAAATGGDVRVSVGGRAGAVPEIGMWMDVSGIPAARSCSDMLGHLRPAFLGCYVDATERTISFAGLAEVAAVLDAPLALEVVVPGRDPKAELAGIAAAAKSAGVQFRDIAASRASDLGFVIPGTEFADTREFDELFAAARQAFPAARIGGGNFVYFTELNRKPVPTDQLDFVTHGTCALVHAADDRSVTETIECLPSVFASVRAQYGDLAYRVSPAGIGSRTSPFGGGPTPNPNAARVTMTDKDPRQRGLAGAAWHLGYAARAAEAGIDSLALATPNGGFGLIHAPADHAQPWYDEAGGLYPVFHVMRALYAASGAARLATGSSAPRDVQALAFEETGQHTLWLANLTAEARPITIEGFAATKIALLDQSGFITAAAQPDALDHFARPPDGQLVLPPHGLACLGTHARSVG